MKAAELIKREGGGRREDLTVNTRGGGGCHLTWVSRRTLGQSVGQIGQLAAMVTVLQGADVHAAPPAELPEPEAFLLGFVVRIQHDAHPQGACRDMHRLKHTHSHSHTHLYFTHTHLYFHHRFIAWSQNFDSSSCFHSRTRILHHVRQNFTFKKLEL